MMRLASNVTVRHALSRAREMLAENNIEDASLESELLLRHTLRQSSLRGDSVEPGQSLKIDRVQLYLELDRQLSPDQSEQFWSLIERRLKGEPSAYIVGHREFYGLDFYVNSSVLIPRPETELLVDKTLELAQRHALCSMRYTICDIGTGCGAIAISLALKLPQAKIYATDISAAALKVAAVNCEKHGVTERVYLLEGDLLEPLPEPVDMLVANLPYVSESKLSGLNTHGFEPVLALNGGPDGLEKIRRLCSQTTNNIRPGGGLLLEIGQGQEEAVITLLCNLFPSTKVEIFPDLAGVGRVVGMIL